MGAFEIRDACRQSVKPLVGFYGESGTGKTYSALLLARGLVGPSGKIVMIDTESGRGELYSDIPVIGGYKTIPFREPFTPARYTDAIKTAEAGGASVLVIDSISHSWEGVGGVLEMAAEIEEKSGKKGLHCWNGPKTQHKLMMLTLLQSPLPIIVCLRAKHKSRQVKDDKGKTVIVKDDFATPIQAEDFIFELTSHAEILQDHSIRLTKCSHPSLKDCFPTVGPITTAHGEALARWCAAPGAAPVATTTAKKGATPATRDWMIAALTPVEQFAIQYAIDKKILLPNEGLQEWPLASVPTSKAALGALVKAVQDFSEGK